ncbi:ead/Ea22-like family protein [Chitinilyticum aquatile]|uniref:ead/Ea22-like family protein n=1 Tax=Chitinilyticum aquatile TaxID=362520 RepID=UPI000429A9AB|nr:ead/Ea22-like family protein [Chitinilyticum aquatile]
MTPEQINELRELAQRATQGVWRWDGDFVALPRPLDAPAIICEPYHRELDGQYIAAANPQAILALLDELDGLRAAVRELSSTRDDLAEKLEALEKQEPVAVPEGYVPIKRSTLQGLVDLWNLKGRGRSGSPQHGHTIPDIWDQGNPEGIAGKPCAECTMYDEARAALAAAPQPDNKES